MPGSYFRAKYPNRYRRAGRAINAIKAWSGRIVNHARRTATHSSQIKPIIRNIMNKFPTRKKRRGMIAVFKNFGRTKKRTSVSNLLKWGPMPR